MDLDKFEKAWCVVYSEPLNSHLAQMRKEYFTDGYVMGEIDIYDNWALWAAYISVEMLFNQDTVEDKYASLQEQTLPEGSGSERVLPGTPTDEEARG